MGYHFWAKTTVWTLIVLVIRSVAFAFDHSLLLDLGLGVLPDQAKINISLEEYTNVITKFLSLRDSRSQPVPELKVFKLDKHYHHHRRLPLKMTFPIQTSTAELESAALRLLLPPQHNDLTTIKVQVNQILGTRRRRFLQEQVLYLSNNLTKWSEFDVTSAVSSWMNGHKNLGLELVCSGCNNNLSPLEAAVTSLVYLPHKLKRSLPAHERGKTNCRQSYSKGRKKKCCRHEMQVTFTKLPFPQMNLIVEPKSYEAGFCHGLCPPNYHLASNHSRIQGLMHQINKREANVEHRKNIPKTCCAPSILEPLDILLVNTEDPSKLKVETWDNMRVVECACS